MKAQLKEGIQHLFTPEFHTAISGQSIIVTRQELVEDWPKYIYTPAGSLYSNLKELRQKYKESKGTVSEPVVLDMKAAKQRGTVFNQPTKKQQLAKRLADFTGEQIRRRAKLQKRQEAKEKREKEIAAKARKAANDKARRSAKKTEA